MQENSHPTDELLKSFDYKGKEYKIKGAGYDSQKCSLDFVKNALLILNKTDILLKSTKDNKKILLEKALISIISGKKI